jgi:hypothetical protein
LTRHHERRWQFGHCIQRLYCLPGIQIEIIAILTLMSMCDARVFVPQKEQSMTPVPCWCSPVEKSAA